MKPLYLTPLLLAAAAAGCGQGQAAAPAANQAGISGLVRVGPTCPSVSISNPCPDKPVKGALLRIRRTDTGVLVKAISTDSRGRFSVTLLPGAYTVIPVNDHHYLRTPSVRVRVAKSKTAHVVVTLDNGMR